MDSSAEREVVLVVEDEPAIRRMIDKALSGGGYTVLQASNGLDAETLIEAHTNIRLVILDIVMPGGNGLDFANYLHTQRPGTEILYISGFADSIAVDSIARRKPMAMLTKPFTPSQLLDRVRKLTAA